VVKKQTDRKLRELAERITKAEDAQKFSELVEELGRLLDSQSTPRKPHRQRETLK
jgi:hypothetical protein